jgi:serine/threonine-protein kinase
VTTVAGTGVAGFTDGPVTTATFKGPRGVAVRNNVVFVADSVNNAIRQIQSLAVSTYASGSSAGFLGPEGVAVDSAGNVFVADRLNNRIARIDALTRTVTAFAGTGVAGFANGPGNLAQFNGPHGLAIDSADNVYVADTTNNAIRKITPAGVVSLLAGKNTSGAVDGTISVATFFSPFAVAVDGAFNVYVADTGNNKIRKITQ